jgi:hypothetical protein
LEISAAKKRQSELELVSPSSNENQLEMVLFQEPSSSGANTVPPEPVRVEQRQLVQPPIIEDDESMPVDKSESNGNENDDYNIEYDPGLRAPISSYPVNDQDSVRRVYIALGPCRPNMKMDNFPQHDCGGMHRFQPKWFDEFKWLEYSVHKDTTYCFICYLFKDSSKFPSADAFVE